MFTFPYKNCPIHSMPINAGSCANTKNSINSFNLLTKGTNFPMVETNNCAARFRENYIIYRRNKSSFPEQVFTVIPHLIFPKSNP